MKGLESVVLPLPESRALAEAGIKMDTALVWVHTGQGWWNGGGWDMDKEGAVHEIPFVPTGGYADEVRTKSAVNSLCTALCPAPVLSELLDAIRAGAIKKVCGMDDDETTVILSRHYAGGSMCGVRTVLGEYEVTQAPTDLLAAYALLMEVTQ